jgi:hypothetical protein
MQPANLSSVLPDLHDGRLDGLFISRNRTAWIYATDFEGRAWTLVLDRVERLRADEFREGNIILEAVCTAGQLQVTDIERVYDLTAAEREAPWVRTLLARTGSESLAFVELTSSYGCRLVALCGRCSVSMDHIFPPHHHAAN